MPTPIIISNTIVINAATTTVWNALVNPEQTKKYMFGCETISDWLPGSQLLWQGSFEGKTIVFVKGTIISIEKDKTLTYTVFDPNGALEDIPENYLTVTYSLTEENGQTTLTVAQGDYALVVDGEKRYLETYNGGEGWNPILLEIKKLVESE